ISRGLSASTGVLPEVEGMVPTNTDMIIPSGRTRYLSEIADTVRRYHAQTEEQVQAIRKYDHLATAREALITQGADIEPIDRLLEDTRSTCAEDIIKLLETWPDLAESYREEEFLFTVRDQQLRTDLW